MSLANLDADSFAAFARSLPKGIDSPSGQPFHINDVVDFDMCLAYNFTDPWDNKIELNGYEYKRIKRERIETDGIEPVRYWPRALYEQYTE
jgi:hypothetical protein